MTRKELREKYKEMMTFIDEKIRNNEEINRYQLLLNGSSKYEKDLYLFIRENELMNYEFFGKVLINVEDDNFKKNNFFKLFKDENSFIYLDDKGNNDYKEQLEKYKKKLISFCSGKEKILESLDIENKVKEFKDKIKKHIEVSSSELSIDVFTDDSEIMKLAKKILSYCDKKEIVWEECESLYELLQEKFGEKMFKKGNYYKFLGLNKDSYSKLKNKNVKKVGKC